MLELFKNIRARRKELGMSQTELALKVGYTNKSTIATIEAGKMNIPISKILQIADALEIDASALMGLSTAEINISDIENKMKSLDIIALDRIIKYAEYLKTLQGGD